MFVLWCRTNEKSLYETAKSIKSTKIGSRKKKMTIEEFIRNQELIFILKLVVKLDALLIYFFLDVIILSTLILLTCDYKASCNHDDKFPYKLILNNIITTLLSMFFYILQECISLKINPETFIGQFLYYGCFLLILAPVFISIFILSKICYPVFPLPNSIISILLRIAIIIVCTTMLDTLVPYIRNFDEMNEKIYQIKSKND